MEKLFRNKQRNIYLFGDFNINLLNYSSNNQVNTFLDYIYSFGLFPLITKPTRITSHSATLIDNIHTITHDYAHMSGIILCDINDHITVFTCKNLTHRKQYVQIKGTKFSLESIPGGFPQGSILGPILFNLYINDICNVSSILEFTLFADDTNIICSHDSTTSSCNTLNTELERLNAWFNLNKLSLSLQKTNYITFSTINSDCTIQIAINGSNFEKDNSTKYLGVCIRHHPNWKYHIAYVSSKLSKSTAVIHKTSHVPDTKILTLLHNAIILFVSQTKNFVSTRHSSF